MSDRLETGGCLCGAVRYEALGEPLWTANCHCTDCRKASGAAFVPYAGYASTNVRIVKGTPTEAHRSSGVTRSFCSACGSPLFYQSTRWPGETHIFVGTLDHPERFPPQWNIYTKEQLPWLHLEGDIPSHDTVPGKSE